MSYSSDTGCGMPVVLAPPGSCRHTLHRLASVVSVFHWSTNVTYAPAIGSSPLSDVADWSGITMGVARTDC